MNKKNKNLAAALAVLTGWAGGHHYYLGTKVAGIIELCGTVMFFGIGALAGLIEGILLLAMTQEDFDAAYNGETPPKSHAFVFMAADVSKVRKGVAVAAGGGLMAMIVLPLALLIAVGMTMVAKEEAQLKEAHTLFSAGQIQQAMDIYEKCPTTVRFDQQALNNMCEHYAKTNQHDKLHETAAVIYRNKMKVTVQGNYAGIVQNAVDHEKIVQQDEIEAVKRRQAKVRNDAFKNSPDGKRALEEWKRTGSASEAMEKVYGIK